MDAGEAKKDGDPPARVYTRRLRELNQAQAAEQRTEKLLGYSKLAVAALTVVAAVVFLHYPSVLEFLLLPVAVFLVLAVLQENLIRKLRYRARAIAFYERGQARVEDRWAGTGESG